MARVIAALAKDGLVNNGAIFFAWAGDIEHNFWLASCGRPGVLPTDIQVMHFDSTRKGRDRIRDVPLSEVPESMEWEPWHAPISVTEEGAR